MKNNVITFVIVTWNNENDIENCLRSIQEHVFICYKIIVIDNNSSDETVNIIRRDFSDVDLITNKNNYGFAYANNQALDLIDSPYVCFINPDTILIEDIVIPSIELLEKNENVGVVSARLLNKDMTIQPSAYYFDSSLTLILEIMHLHILCPNILSKYMFPYKYIASQDFKVDWVIGAEMILRTEDAKKIGGFSTEYYMYTEDMDFCKKIRTIINKDVIMSPKIRLIHLGGQSERYNISYNKTRMLLRNKIYFIYKFGGSTKAHSSGKAILKALYVRLFLLFVFFHKKTRKQAISKTKTQIDCLKDILIGEKYIIECDAVKQMVK